MAMVSGDEPAHWHDADGRHRMRDPRSVYERSEMFEGRPVANVPRRLWDPDERAYTEHLEAHEQGATSPAPRGEDPPEVTTLFDVIDANERTNKAASELIAAIRQRQAAGQ